LVVVTNLVGVTLLVMVLVISTFLVDGTQDGPA
jgi:hypothetical protein